jgi:hypothetical protein
MSIQEIIDQINDFGSQNPNFPITASAPNNCAGMIRITDGNAIELHPVSRFQSREAIEKFLIEWQVDVTSFDYRNFF